MVPVTEALSFLFFVDWGRWAEETVGFMLD